MIYWIVRVRLNLVCSLETCLRATHRQAKSCSSLAQTGHIGLNELIQEYSTRVNLATEFNRIAPGQACYPVRIFFKGLKCYHRSLTLNREL